MPTTPDRPDGRPAGSGDAEPPAEPDQPAVEHRETVRIDTANHETQRVGPRQTVLLDRANHETVKLPGQRKPERSGRAPLVVAAGFATLWAAVVSAIPIAAVIGLARSFEGAGGLGGATSAGLAAWLLAHGVPLTTSIGPLALTPLLITGLALWRLNRAGVHVVRAVGARENGSVRTALLAAGAVGAWYAVLGAIAAAVLSGPDLAISARRAALHLFLIGVTGALAGTLRSTGALGVLARTVPPVLRHGLRTGVVAALLILAAGAACTGLSVAVGGGTAADMIAAYRTGVAGQAGITLVSLVYGGNAAIWAAAYLLGPGFALGAGSTVRLTEVTVGPLPTLPLLSGLPEGPMGAAGALLLAVPVVAGMCAGWLLTQRMAGDLAARAQAVRAQAARVQAARAQAGRTVAVRPSTEPAAAQPAWSRVIGAAALAGPVAGLLLGVLSGISGGSLGEGRLAQIGPVPWQVAAIATAVVAASAVTGGAAARAFARRPK